MGDPTEDIRRAQQAEINADKSTREQLQAKYGQVWNTAELQIEFDVIGFLAPYAIVRRKADGKTGSVMFRHSPRIYFSFQEDK